MLEALGFLVTEAADGAEALDRCRDALPDVIILDWNMPVLDGPGFLAAFAEGGFAARPRIIVCTTEHGVAHIRQAVAAGADDFLLKPFDRDTLESKLHLMGLA